MNMTLQQGLGDLRGDYQQYLKTTVVKYYHQKEQGSLMWQLGKPISAVYDDLGVI